MRVGLIGFGTIGRQVADGILAGLAGDVTLCAVLVRRSRDEAVPLVTDLAAMLGCAPEVVVEAASSDAVTVYAERVVETGATLILASAAALVDAALRMRLEAASRRSGAKVIVASGALVGVDALAAAAVGGLDEVALRVVEPGSQSHVVFAGSVADGARRFPSRLNVAATIASIADGSVVLEQQPGEKRVLEMRASGSFGEFRSELQPNLTTHIVALSLLASLRRLQQPVQLG